MKISTDKSKVMVNIVGSSKSNEMSSDGGGAVLSIPGLKGLQVRDGRLSQDYGSNSGDGQA